jgi:hypothetical protein
MEKFKSFGQIGGDLRDDRVVIDALELESGYWLRASRVSISGKSLGCAITFVPEELDLSLKFEDIISDSSCILAEVETATGRIGIVRNPRKSTLDMYYSYGAELSEILFLKKDGSVELTADWNIGDGKKILADEIKARNTDGLNLLGSTGKGFAINTTIESNTDLKIGGKIGAGGIVPTKELDINGDARIREDLVVDDNVLVFGNIGIGNEVPEFPIDAYVNREDGVVRCARFKTDGNHVNARGLVVWAGEDTESCINYWFEAYDGNGSVNTGGLRSVEGVFGVYNASDKNLKKNIRDTNVSGKDMILNLKIRDFEWKRNPGKKITGLVAQEVLKVCPDAVGDPDPETGMYGMSRLTFIPFLIKHNQEMQIEIENLTERIAGLERNYN